MITVLVLIFIISGDLLSRRMTALNGSNSPSLDRFHSHGFVFHRANSNIRGSSSSKILLEGISQKMATPAETDQVCGSSTGFSNAQQQQSLSIELWLDLRGTAISPRVALHHLLTEEQQSSTEASANEDEDLLLYSAVKNLKVNRVLISNLDEQEYKKLTLPNAQMKPFDEMISNGLILVRDKTENHQLLSDPSDYYPLVHVSPTSYESQQYAGEIVVMKDDATILANPIPAMTCLERGGWIVLDPSNIHEERDRMNSVSNIVNLLSGSSSSLHLLSNTDEGQTSSMSRGETDGSTNCSGGVAVVCSTNQDLFNFSQLIESLRSQSDSSIKVNESGILTFSSSQQQRYDAKKKATTRKATALVLPFDVVLWKTLSCFM